MKNTRKFSIWLSILFLGEIVLIAVGIINRQETLIAGSILWGTVLFGAWLFRPSSKLHAFSMDNLSVKGRCILSAIVFCTILAVTLPMSLSPHWNGSIKSEVSEYEDMTRAILKGQLWLDIEVDPRLETLENPYSWHERSAIEDLDEAWDHAYYKGRYYMYFGIVPVFLVFIPMYFLTGTVILSYHATQIIAVFTVLGLFALFSLLAKAFFPKIKVSHFTFMTILSTAIILWYPINAPALYCTATLSGVCLMIWCLYFFIKAVYIEKNENQQVGLASLGSLCGALVIGCRPPIAIANLCIIPLFLTYIRSKIVTPRLIGKLIAAALPYLVIIGLLMVYNKARFDSFFEFGQSYQLTLADQHEYSSFISAFRFDKFISDLYTSFFSVNPFKDSFPYISYSGIFCCFPVLFFIFAAFMRPVRPELRAHGLIPFCISLFLVPLLIIMMDGLWSPFLLERYKLDYSFILCILCFLSIGFLSQKLSPAHKHILLFLLYFLMILSVFVAGLLFLIPMDYNYTFYFGDSVLDLADSVLLFWHYL